MSSSSSQFLETLVLRSASHRFEVDRQSEGSCNWSFFSGSGVSVKVERASVLCGC